MTEVIMPQMGESIAEGTITKWYKKVGETIERDEPLFEISTDKVDTEIPSPASGVLAEIKIQEGETVPVNTVVAVIGAASAEPKAAPAPPAPSPAPPAPSEAKAAPAGAQAPRPPAPPPSADPSPSGAGLRSSPLVRKMAREHGLDLTKIPGTGRGGRISKHDVQRYLDERERGAGHAAPAPAPAAASAPPSPPSVSATAPARPAAAHPPAAAAQPPPGAAPHAASGRVEVESMSSLRRSIAEHMIGSRRTSAHVTTVFEVDMSRVVHARESAKRVFEREEGVKLTYTPFFVRAVTGALKTFPLLNASIDGENIVHHKDYNIGVAVSLEGGLIVPVIHRADEKSFLGLARAVADLAERARTKKLKPEDVQGGTFTVTNPGPYGSLFGTPIINQPQVAILGVGGIHKRPVVVNDAIAVRSMVYLALSFDHRLIDGALGDQFMADVKRRLETWDEKIL